MSTTEQIEEPEAKKAPEKPLTREQRRFMERVENEAKATIQMLTEKFFNCIMESDDPEGQEVTDKMNQVCSQWELYCFRKRLNPEAKYILKGECKAIVEQYYRIKNADKTEVE